jgi:hypothetical protein
MAATTFCGFWVLDLRSGRCRRAVDRLIRIWRGKEGSGLRRASWAQHDSGIVAHVFTVLLED